jgi:arylsulfatase A-like enzyme
MPGDRPNVLFVFPDQHRHDWVGYDGDVPVRTPTLDSLLDDGVAFRNAVTPAPVCGPARSCLASGVEYDRSYVRDHHAGQDFPVGAPTVYGHLRDQGGYHTMATGKFDLQKYSHDAGLDGQRFLHENGFSAGINVETELASPVDEPKGPYQQYVLDEGYEDVFADEFPRAVHDTFPTELPPDAYQDNWIGRQTERLLRDAPEDQPWFMQVNFTKPHPPWDVTEEMHGWYRDPDVEFPSPLDPGDETDPETHQEVRRNYAAMVENVDRWVGRLLEVVERRGERENTVVVYASDHGESLGDRGSWYKRTPYRESAGVPLLVSGPPVAERGVVDAPATVLDVAATALDYADVSVPGLGSQSMRPYLDGATDDPPRDVVFSGLGPWRMAFDGRYKLVRGFDPERPHNEQVSDFDSYEEAAVQRRTRETGPLLFDLETDPLERENVAGHHPDIVGDLDDHLGTLRS